MHLNDKSLIKKDYKYCVVMKKYKIKGIILFNFFQHFSAMSEIILFNYSLAV